MARRLKVFVVPAGFHDAYVAAPSRKAALDAWGSEHDLFARGIAHEVTDPALTAEPLAHPGAVIKRSRGTTAEQIAALPDDAVRPADDAPPAKPRKASVKAAKVAPKPSRDALHAAEQAVEEGAEQARREDAALAERQAALDRDRRALATEHRLKQQELTARVEEERARYDRKIARWRKG